MSLPSRGGRRRALVAELRSAGCVFAEEEADLLLAEASSTEALGAMVARRVAGAPLEYVLGWAEFHGLRVAVDPGVFVPRRRTEFLVDEAVSIADPGSVVVDLCCGSGALGAALLAVVPSIELYAADIDPVAVRCARRNLPVDRVFIGDLFDALPAPLRGRIELVLANTPYVPSLAIALLPSEAREHEARIALDGGADGLDIQRRLAAEALAWLAPGGSLLVEASERQAPLSVAVFEENGLETRISYSEEYETTVVIATRRAPGLLRD